MYVPEDSPTPETVTLVQAAAVCEVAINEQGSVWAQSKHYCDTIEGSLPGPRNCKEITASIPPNLLQQQ